MLGVLGTNCLLSPADIVDIKPKSMEDLTELITAATFQASDCSVFLYSNSRGCIKMGDMRASALCDQHAKGTHAWCCFFLQAKRNAITHVKNCALEIFHGSYFTFNVYLSNGNYDSRADRSTSTQEDECTPGSQNTRNCVLPKSDHHPLRRIPALNLCQYCKNRLIRGISRSCPIL